MKGTNYKETNYRRQELSQSNIFHREINGKKIPTISCIIFNWS